MACVLLRSIVRRAPPQRGCVIFYLLVRLSSVSLPSSFDVSFFGSSWCFLLPRRIVSSPFSFFVLCLRRASHRSPPSSGPPPFDPSLHPHPHPPPTGGSTRPPLLRQRHNSPGRRRSTPGSRGRRSNTKPRTLSGTRSTPSWRIQDLRVVSRRINRRGA